MISEFSRHRRSTGKTKMFGFAQLLMEKTQIGGASHQIPPGFQCAQATGGVTACARQDSQAFTERAVDPLNESRVPNRSPKRSQQQGVGSLLLSRGQGPRDFSDTFLLCARDHRNHAPILPHT